MTLKKKEKKKRLRNLYFERSTVKIYQIYERSSWSSSTDANDRSSREKSPKWRTSKHDYTTTNVKKTSDSSFKACIYFHDITIQCRERKKKSVQSNVSPRKLAFPIHFASCWINDDWVHDSDFHYSQSTLTLETFECVSSFYEGDETSSPNLIVTDIVIRATIFVLSSSIKKIPNLQFVETRLIKIEKKESYRSPRSNKIGRRSSPSELIFSIRPRDFGPCREKTLIHRHAHTRACITGGGNRRLHT